MAEFPTDNAARFRVGPAYAGYRLDQFLQRMIPRLSRSRIQRAITERVRLSWDAPVKASTPVREGGLVLVDDPQIREEEVDFDPAVLYEDGDMLAIDKPPGLVVHPTHSHLRNTVITLLRRRRGEPDLTLAHRLDMETSGVLLLGRHTWAARKIQTAFERGFVTKSYLALVHGSPESDRFEIQAALGPFSRDNLVFRQAPASAGARAAHTRFSVLERAGGITLLQADLLTGRRHQIRAHLAFAELPVVGDKLYSLSDARYRKYLRQGSVDDETLRSLGAARTMLHSHRLTIPHPRDRERRVEIVAPMPADMAAILAAARRPDQPAQGGP